MTREKAPRPATLDEALKDYGRNLDQLVSLSATLNDNVKTGAFAKAEQTIKDGHATVLAVKDSYNYLTTYVQNAARKKDKPADAKPAKKDEPAKEKKDADDEDGDV